MKTFLIRFLTLVGGIFLVSYVFPGIVVEGVAPAFMAAVFLGIVNVFFKPFLRLIAFPLNLLTFGLFTLVINAAILWVTGVVIDGFYVTGFVQALGAALVISILVVFTQEFMR